MGSGQARRYKGKIRACDSVAKLRDLMHLPSLVEIFAQLAEERDLQQAARDIVDVMKS